MTRNDKARRRELLRKYKEAGYADARRTLCLGLDELNSLPDYLDRHLEDTPCDHTLRFTGQWAEQHGKATSTVTAAVRMFGGYCDCEVLANVTPDKFGWPD